MAIPVGLCVKIVRENSGLTIREAAEKIGLSATSLYKFEEFTACYNPFTPVRKNSFGTAVEKFFLDNFKNIKSPLVKNHVKKILDGKSIEVSLFQDCFYHSLLSFLEFSLVQTHGEFGSSYGGLFYILRDLLLFFDNTSSKNKIAVSCIKDDVTSHFLGETFLNQWGINRTKRRKNSYKYDDIVFTQEENQNIIGYLEPKEDTKNFLGRVFYEDTFVSLLFYLLLDKFSCSFFTRDNSEYEQELWDYFKNTHEGLWSDSVNNIFDPSVYTFLDKNVIPPYRDIFVLNTRFGSTSICCRSLVGGYHYDMFIIFANLLDFS